MFYGDYHTHTRYSHGSGTIYDNVKRASEAGLKEIAISDHGYAHLTCGVNRKKIDEIKEKIKAASDDFKDVRVLLSIEANILNNGGDIDITEKDYEHFDIILAGYHHVVKGKRGSFFNFFLPNHFCNVFHAVSKRRLKKNTRAVINAVSKNRIDILTHLNYGLKTNVAEVAEACKEAGTFIELNGKRINFSRDEFLRMVKTGVRFIINSDAHSPDRVGDMSLGLKFIEGLDFDRSCIVNMDSEKSPAFISARQ
jgi:putative hydrolase